MSQQPPEWGQVPPPPPPLPSGQMAPGVFTSSNAPQPGQSQRTDGFAIASLCCSLGFLLVGCLGIVTSILAIVFAHVAERRIRESNGMLGGAGLAKAGKIVGWVGIGLWVVGVIAYLVFFVVVLANSDPANALPTMR